MTGRGENRFFNAPKMWVAEETRRNQTQQKVEAALPARKLVQEEKGQGYYSHHGSLLVLAANLV